MSANKTALLTINTMKLLLTILLLKILGFALLQAQYIPYPDYDFFENSCYLRDGSQGVCRDIRACPWAHGRRRHRPVTCYFTYFQHFVCCKDRVAFTTIPIPTPTPQPEIKKHEKTRESSAIQACNRNYPIGFGIIGGFSTKPREFPYMVALGWKSLQPNTYDYKCGGVLIANEYVLTAAHCTEVNGLAPLVVLLGGNNLTDSSVDPVRIAKVIKHPQYNASTAYNDIALLKLEQSVFDQLPACLEDSPSDLQNINVIAIGYGHTAFAGPSSAQLLKAYLRILSKSDCQRYYAEESSLPNGIVDTQICGKDPKQIRDTCQGDSGGPIIRMIEKIGTSRPYIVGITSFGQGCATETPGVYTRIYPFLDWIESTVWPRDSVQPERSFLGETEPNQEFVINIQFEN